MNFDGDDEVHESIRGCKGREGNTMEVIGTIELQDQPTNCTAVRVRADGTCETVYVAVQEENLLSAYVNDVPVMQLDAP